MLHSQAEISLHSPDAAILFKGGKKNSQQFIPSYFYTQRKLNSVYQQGLANNPYAEAALMDIQYEIDGVLTLCENKISRLNGLLDKSKENGINPVVMTNDNPTKHVVKYLTEYASLMLKMMSRVDLSCLMIRTCHTMNIIDDALATDALRQLKRSVRAVFDKIVSYDKNILKDVTREDIRMKTAAAKVMAKKLGIPNDSVMNSEVSFAQRRLGLLGSDRSPNHATL